MNYIISTFLLLSALSLVADEFNVNFDSSGTPLISGPGGTIPPPDDLPNVSNLIASPDNTVHVKNNILWMDSYQSGDYFSFSVVDTNTENSVNMNGIWFGVWGTTAQTPDNFRVEMWSSNTLIGSREASDSGVYLWNTDWGSIDNSAEIRIIGIGGIDDIGSGPFDTFGIEFISANFTVIPEPSSVLLLGVGAGGILFYRRSKRRQQEQQISRRNFS